MEEMRRPCTYAVYPFDTKGCGLHAIARQDGGTKQLREKCVVISIEYLPTAKLPK
jgi:hypothetical protein